uniref:Craniofacial development protein 2-like n=1 Tax=Romanomermis culicivorax TaxID=13658 RepID=A0A915K5A4_ROMCU
MDDTRVPEFQMIPPQYGSLGNYASRIQRSIINNVQYNANLGYKMIAKRNGQARFGYGHAKATVVQVYALMDSAEDTVKNDFYNQLQDIFDDIPNDDLKILIGDLNAQMGGDRLG